MIKSQYAGGILLQPVQKLVATLIFARLTQGQKCKRGPFAVPEKIIGLPLILDFFDRGTHCACP